MLGTNWAWILAIFFLVVTVRVILFPIFVKQIKSQRAMQALQPKVKELQEKHKGDRETLQKEMMELYRKEKANPLMGCLPMFLQIPVFLGLFHVLRTAQPAARPTTIDRDLRLDGGAVPERLDGQALHRADRLEVRLHARADLAALGADGTTVKIVAGILVVIMIATTYLTSRQMILKTGWAEDPQQKMIQRLMLYGIPASLLVSGGALPDRRDHLLGHQQPVLPRPSSSGCCASTRRRPSRSRATAAGKAVPAGKAATPRRGAPAKDAAAKNGKAGAAPAIDGKALAPKPGAKPINPKKGGAAKRQG